MKIIIDGKEIEAREGSSVLDAALEAGVFIPHLCSHPDLEAKGGCRLCAVEIDGVEGAVPACKTTATDGMVVTIKGAEAERVRKTAMELILATHPADCTGCPKFGKCELQSIREEREGRRPVPLRHSGIERMKEIGRNLVEAAQEIKEDNEKYHLPIAENTKSYWRGKKGACPHCQGNAFYIFPGTTHCVCELCGLEGTLEVVDGAFQFKFAPEDEHKAHDIISGKKLHGDDIFENEGRLMNLGKDPEFKARKAYYTAVVEPTPSPSKQ